MILWILNDNTIEIAALTDSKTGAAITDATVTAQIKDSAGESVGSAVTMTHVSAGRYSGDAPASLSLENEANYTAEVSASSSGRDGFWRIPCKAKYRT